MGHTQCISRSGTEKIVTLRGSSRLHPPGPKELNGPETSSNFHQDKDSAVQAEGKELEPPREQSSEDAKRLQRAMAHLQESGWYWGSISAAEAMDVLNECAEGAFLLRDSSNPHYLLALSAKTSMGTTHLRLEYSGGEFGFDSVVVVRPQLRQFEGAVDLVQFYSQAHRRRSTHTEPDTAQTHTRDRVQTVPDSSIELRLTRPRRKTTLSLQHLCRLTINQHSRNHSALPLPDRLKNYLLEYPFIL
ncbi:suppressor of cytokine signaling 2-like [Hoplias malabaricus]|uniref:suppressor of cytokine signaling 2-like n=1 Tax=Hoplias malabaricus TaxID=27720 RepID=UPI003462CE16